MLTLSMWFRRGADRLAVLPGSVTYLIILAAVVFSHFTLLRLPYYWDEGGYYIPAALDFYHRYTLIPQFTNAHPPLPNIVLGSLWHVFGFHILTTRLIVCAFAAAGLLAVLRLASDLLDSSAAVIVTALTGIYPIWFAQSTLAHADIFAAAFTLWAFVFYFRANAKQSPAQPDIRTLTKVVVLFSLAALSKETAIIEPAALAGFQLWRLWQDRRTRDRTQRHALWLLALSAPVLPLLAWYAYHRMESGFTFGNPEYLRYNATANFNTSHILTAFRYRFVHLAWQRNIWFPIVVSVACLFFKPNKATDRILPGDGVQIIGVLVLVNWIAFSILGGALLTRYLLPIYTLILLVCVAVWRSSTAHSLELGSLTAAAFLLALWWSPPAAFAPEDNLTYRDMILLHEHAIAFIDRRFPDAKVLTSWPAAAELYRPELGYTDRKIMGPEIDNFSAEEISKAAQGPETFDTAFVFSKNFVPPSLSGYLAAHPNSDRARYFASHRDLSPSEIAQRLGGQIVFDEERNGEWVAVLRFPRRYEAQLMRP